MNQGPAGRTGTSVVYDSLRHRVVLFGGLQDSPGTHMNHSVNDTWVLDMFTRTWTQVATDTTQARPGTRFRPAHDLDPLRDRWIITCGADTVSLVARDTVRFWNDTWAFDLNTLTWSQLATTNPPVPRYDITGYVIPDQDRFVFFGGAIQEQYDVSEWWSLDLATNQWTLETPSGVVPHERNGYSMVFNRARRWLIPYAGTDGNSLLSDGAIFYQAPIETGITGLPSLPDGTVRDVQSGPLRLSTVRRSSTPVMDLLVHLDGGGRADLRVLTPAGHCVWATSVTVPPSGESAVRWNGRTATDRELANGVYFMSAGARSARVTQKVVIVR